MQLTFLCISSIQSFDKIILPVNQSTAVLVNFIQVDEWSRQQEHRTGDVAGGGVAQDGHQGAEK